MRIDEIINRIDVDSEITKNKVVLHRYFHKRFRHNPKSKKLCIIFPPRHIPKWIFRRLLSNIFAQGYSYCVYEFSPFVLSPDHARTKEYFLHIRNFARGDIRALIRSYGYTEFSVVGISIGCVPACMTANELRIPLRNLILVTPGHCLAESMWNGIRTRTIRTIMQKNGITLPFLKQEWHVLAPEHNIDSISASRVRVYLSRSDRVIPFKFGMHLVSAFHNRNAPLSVSINKNLGHYCTALRFCLSPDTL